MNNLILKLTININSVISMLVCTDMTWAAGGDGRTAIEETLD